MIGRDMKLGPVPRAICVAALLCTADSAPGQSENRCDREAMLVFDGSGSMSEMGFNLLDEPRIFEARRAVREVMPELTRQRDVGLLIYGPGARSGCENVTVHFTPMPGAGERIIATIDGLRPAGDTPLTRSVQEAVEVLETRGKPGVIVVVTDGKENCGGAPCQFAANLMQRNAGHVVHVIGFRVRGEHFSYSGPGNDDYQNGTTIARCMAEQTGGLFLTTETAEDLIGALRKTLGCAVIG